MARSKQKRREREAESSLVSQLRLQLGSDDHRPLSLANYGTSMYKAVSGAWRLLKSELSSSPSICAVFPCAFCFVCHAEHCAAVHQKRTGNFLTICVSFFLFTQCFMHNKKEEKFLPYAEGLFGETYEKYTY